VRNKKEEEDGKRKKEEKGEEEGRKRKPEIEKEEKAKKNLSPLKGQPLTGQTYPSTFLPTQKTEKWSPPLRLYPT
jgi:hypothetical protein